MATEDYTLVVDRYVHLQRKDPEDETSRVIKRTRYSKGDTIPGHLLSDEDADRLVAAGAIVPVGADEEDFVPQVEPDEDPTDIGVKGDVVLENPDSPGGLAGTEDEESEESEDEESEDKEQVTRVTGDYATWDYPEIKAEAERRGITGPDGSLKKKDLVPALFADDKA